MAVIQFLIATSSDAYEKVHELHLFLFLTQQIFSVLLSKMHKAIHK